MEKEIEIGKHTEKIEEEKERDIDKEREIEIE